ncbi:MAG: terminase TerL endonuclease subunit [Pseudomonadota bacterium]|nr:terminase TerL endonuclease subunit [Pseudomonadota bacterium]
MAKDYAGIARRYAEDVVGGRVPAGVLAIRAARRFLNDLAASTLGASPWRFDETKAAHLCAFCESMRHVEGALRGQRLVLEPWQVFIAANLAGWVEVGSGLRRFRHAYIEVPRKNGKSAFASCLVLYFATVDGEGGAQVVTAATKIKQARIVFDVAAAMARLAPEFRTRVGLIVEEHKLKVPKSDSVVKPLEAKKLDGLNPHFACIDELHEHPTRSVYDALDNALGARLQPLLFVITTAGEDLAGICFEVRERVRRILEGVEIDDQVFGVIYAMDDGDDAFDPATWRKANPNLGVAKSLVYMEGQARKAKASPAALGEFLRKQLGRWTSVGTAALDVDKWRAGFRLDLDRETYRNRGGLLGVDLSIRDDLTSVAWIVEDGSDLVIFADHFATQESANLPGREALLGWAQEGRLRICPGASIDFALVEETIRERASFFGAEEVVFDPHLAAQMAQRLADDGFPMVELRQSPMNLDAAFQRLIALSAEGRIVTDGDPVLLWMASNTIIRKSGDFIRPDKLGPASKIDGIAAVVTALARLAAPEEEDGDGASAFLDMESTAI